MEGFLCGVFGTSKENKSAFEDSIAKKSEVEGIIVYHKNESGVRFSFLDDTSFPEKIQGYSRIASLSDYAYYLFPQNGRLLPPDGELAVLLDAYGLQGTVELIDTLSTIGKETVQSALKGLNVSNYSVDSRATKSSVIDLSQIKPSQNFPSKGTMIYIDRAFSVKGVGVVVLGFVLSGEVSVHDKLRLIPSASGPKFAEVKGIQVSDVDYENASRGIRVGLSLKGIELKDLAKTSWLDDGSIQLSNKISMNYRACPFYKQNIVDRDLHVQLPGELITAKVLKGERDGEISLNLPNEVPIWKEMKIGVIDLNAKNLRIAGAGSLVS